MINKAKTFAKCAHFGQTRNGGEDYFNHLERTVEHLQRHGINNEIILCAAWLHDILEDTLVTHEQLTNEFGREVADLVKELTHEKQYDIRTYVRDMSCYAKLIKLADRLDNITDLKGWKKERIARYINNTKMLLGEINA